MIDFNDVQFSSGSIIDNFGRVFFYKSRVFRLVNSESKKFCVDFLNSKLFEELSKENLIPETKISDLKFDFIQNGIVLEHEKLLETKPNEWTFGMFKDAALMVLKVNRICNQHGFELKDGHTHNVLFKNGCPVFIDIGSFQQRSNLSDWESNSEFVHTFYLPLLLWSKGEYYFLRMLLESDYYHRSIPSQDVFNSIVVEAYKRDLFNDEIRFSKYRVKVSTSLLKPYIKIFNKIIQLFSVKKKYEFFKINNQLKFIDEQNVITINLNNSSSFWQDYHTEFFHNHEVQSTSRFDRIIELINDHCSDAIDVIELAGNQGVFSFLLERSSRFKNLTMTDYDENAVELAYSHVKRYKSKVNPLLLNFMVPFNLISTSNRLRCDIAIALAVTHHLVLTQGFTISSILERLSLFSKKYVVVEFMPLGLWAGDDNLSTKAPDWYTVDWFKSNFERYFILITFEQIEENRIVFIGMKR